ncbi:uncharacterized protein FTOL_12814 [Fusarium torulosum]|uniref:Endonuclease/exonuclease/phosphatase domain-containing protein n=1 Tax=Fusarium torulosum TaxID=33205 RepID=A0AAE8MLH3_9HYPO|nr:uncharacterized protein FTOL_12814 [Fusarium torulosum]
MKSKLTMATALLAQTISGLSQASANPLCSTIINLQPIEYEFQQPILIDSFFPANTNIAIDNDIVVHVTNAPTSLSTVLTDVSRSLTTLTSAVNENPPDGGFITFIVSEDPRDIGNHPVTKTYPATEPGQPDVIVIQVPTSPSRADDLTTSSVPYDTITTTGDFPSLTGPATKIVTPDGPGKTGSVIVEVPNTNPSGSSASYEPGTVIFVVPSSQVPSNSGISISSVPYVTITTTGSLDPTDDSITKTVSPTVSAGSDSVIVGVPPSSSSSGISNTPSNPISFVTLTVTGDDADGDTSTTSILPTASDGTGTLTVEVPPPTNSPSSTIPSDSSSENINNPSSTVPGDSSSADTNTSATSRSASQEPINFYRQNDESDALSILIRWPVPERCLIAGDFNARYHTWQTGHTTNRGQVIVDWASDNNLDLLNTPGIPTNPHGNTIDLAFTNIPLAEATVEDHLATSSGHFTPSLTLPYAGPAPMQPGRIRVTTDDELKRFAEIVELGAAGLPIADSTPSELDELASALVGLLTSAARAAGRPTRKGARNAPWWTEECAGAAAAFRAIRRLYPLGFNEEV